LLILQFLSFRPAQMARLLLVATGAAAAVPEFTLWFGNK